MALRKSYCWLRVCKYDKHFMLHQSLILCLMHRHYSNTMWYFVERMNIAKNPYVFKVTQVNSDDIHIYTYTNTIYIYTVMIMYLLRQNFILKLYIDTVWLHQNGRYLADDIFKCISLNENCSISIQILLKFVPKQQMSQYTAWGKKMYDANRFLLAQFLLDYLRISPDFKSSGCHQLPIYCTIKLICID